MLLLLLSLPLPLPQRQRQRREDAPRSACFRDPSAKPSAILPRKINQSIVDSVVLSFWIMACRAVPWTILPRNLPRNLPQSFRDPSAAAAAAKQCPQQHHHQLMQSFRELSAKPVVSTGTAKLPATCCHVDHFDCVHRPSLHINRGQNNTKLPQPSHPFSSLTQFCKLAEQSQWIRPGELTSPCHNWCVTLE